MTQKSPPRFNLEPQYIEPFDQSMPEPQTNMIMPKVPSLFKYKHDFDKHGALYYLGTLGYTKHWQNPDFYLH